MSINLKLGARIEFFGHRMEAFNMKDDREMGKIEKDGFFVYDRKKDNELRYSYPKIPFD